MKAKYFSTEFINNEILTKHIYPIKLLPYNSTTKRINMNVILKYQINSVALLLLLSFSFKAISMEKIEDKKDNLITLVYRENNEENKIKISPKAIKLSQYLIAATDSLSKTNLPQKTK